LDRVVEEPEDRVPVVVVVLGGVDASLGGDGVGPPGGVVEGEDLDVVAQLAEAGGGGSAGESGADHDDLETALVVGVDEADGELVVVPLVRQRTVGNLGVEAGGGEGHISLLRNRAGRRGASGRWGR